MEKKLEITEPKHGWSKLIIRGQEPFEGQLSYIQNLPYDFLEIFKVYLEHLCINQLTFCYNEKGIPQGLTDITSAVYFTTSGGYIGENNCGFDYVQKLFSQLFGIRDIKFFSAEGLDIQGNDPEQILAQAIEKIKYSV